MLQDSIGKAGLVTGVRSIHTELRKEIVDD